MTNEPASSRDSTRWQETEYQTRAYDKSFGAQAPQLPAPSPINPASQSAILDQRSDNGRAWNNDGRQHGSTENHYLPGPQQPTEYDTDASNYHSRYRGRHSPTPGDPPQLVTTSPRHSFAGSWRSLQQGIHNHLTDGPLTVETQSTYKFAGIQPWSHLNVNATLFATRC